MKKTLLLIAATLLTCCGSGSKENTTPDTPAPEITLSTQSVTLSEEGETKSVSVQVNTSFAISVDQDWLTVSAGSVFKGESVLNLTAKENTTGAARSATVALKRSPSTKTESVPPISSVRLRAMERPRPLPSVERAVSPRVKRSVSSSPGTSIGSRETLRHVRCASCMPGTSAT